MRRPVVTTRRRSPLRLTLVAIAVAVFAATTATATAVADGEAPDAQKPKLLALPEGAGTLIVQAGDAQPVVCSVPIPVTQPLPGECDSRYPEGTFVKVTAVPDPGVPGARFERWSDYRCPEEPTCVLSMDEDRSLTAFFSPVYLKVKSGSFGAVTLTPPGRVCTFMPVALLGEEPCLLAYERGTEVTLSRDAEAEPATSTKEWTGACTGDALTCKLKLLENTFVRAGTPKVISVKSAPLLTLTLNAGSLGGSIKASRGQPGSCRKKCVLIGFRKGDRVTLTANSTKKTKFVKWDNGSKSRRRHLDIGSQTAAKAVFAKKKK